MKKRKLFDTLFAEKHKSKISVVLGPRQVGKTMLLKQLYETLCATQNGLFLDLDILSNYEKVASYENLINTLLVSGYSLEQKGTFYLFLDEFQRHAGFSKVLKNVYDHHKNIKIYATGSSSVKIKGEIQESLAGRKFIHYLYPLDFEEYLLFKEMEESRNQLKNINKLTGQNLPIAHFTKTLQEYMIFGGYPEVSLNDNPADKQQVLSSVFDLYVKKDLVEYVNNKHLLNVKRLIEVLAVNHGQKIKYNELAGICGLKEYELKNYIEILKETFLITELRPYYSNKNKEIVKIPKVYFMDPGVRNYFLNHFSPVEKRKDYGFLFEGFVMSQLLRAGYHKINYWQDKNKREVDFIVNKGHDLIPIEVKFKNTIKQNDFKGLAHFGRQYPKTRNFFLIAPQTQYAAQINEINIQVLLPYHLKLPGF